MANQKLHKSSILYLKQRQGRFELILNTGIDCKNDNDCCNCNKLLGCNIKANYLIDTYLELKKIDELLDYDKAY